MAKDDFTYRFAVKPEMDRRRQSPVAFSAAEELFWLRVIAHLFSAVLAIRHSSLVVFAPASEAARSVIHLGWVGELITAIEIGCALAFLCQALCDRCRRSNIAHVSWYAMTSCLALRLAGESVAPDISWPLIIATSGHLMISALGTWVIARAR